MSKINVALLLFQSTYDSGIDLVINLINNDFQNNNLNIIKYVIDPNNFVTSINNSLTNFVNNYTGRRCTISERTSVLTLCTNFLKPYNIPSFSITATSPAVQSLNNCLTYAPFDKYAVMCLFLIYIEYSMSQIKILIEPNSPDSTFFETYKNEIITQANLLGINVSVDYLDNTINKNYNILSRSHILLLSNTSYLNTLVSNTNFTTQVINATNCYITLSDINDNINDIFGNIPTFILLPRQSDYTITSRYVYTYVDNNLNGGNKGNVIFPCYILYDLLYKLVNFANTSNDLTILNFINYDPFTVNNTLAAWTSGIVFNASINGSDFGTYLAVFSKDVFNIYNSSQYNNNYQGGFTYLPQSKSLFKIIGIVPWNYNQFINDKLDFYGIYNQTNSLIMYGYNMSTSSYPNIIGSNVGTSENIPSNYIYKYSSNGYFSSLIKLYDRSNYIQPTINVSMGKTQVNKYITV